MKPFVAGFLVLATFIFRVFCPVSDAELNRNSKSAFGHDPNLPRRADT
jgi:hypothetical protein